MRAIWARSLKQLLRKHYALCYIVLGNGSFSMLCKILWHSPSIIYRWVVEAMGKTQEPVVSSDIMEMEFDEMWHFIGSKKTSFGSLRQLIVVQGEQLPGLQAIVILQHSKSSTKSESSERMSFLYG
ncbi:hypothetical protein [Candidatus Lariskella endosymbiont of Hedychridium roseum]|uniref:hypothetical protein n=1 Tax=Candidatus Lariskella endosymbiont of Hedychridium roseum TaxID=3077949 RepID=UPI0030D5C3FC